MRTLLGALAIVAFAAGVPAAAQHAPADSAHWARVAGAGRLWANLQLFHPWLASSSRLDWDSVLVAVLPEVEQASGRAGYHDAVAHLLTALHDPVTRVRDSIPPGDVGGDSRYWRWEADSVLVIRMADVRVSDSDPVIPFDTLRPLIHAAKAVVFDGRAERPGQLDDAGMMLSYSNLEGAFSDTTLRTIPDRRRYHTGLKPARDIGTGQYYGEGWKADEGRIIPPDSGNRRRPTVFLVNHLGWLPRFALPLRRAGRAMIVGDGAATDKGAVTSMTLSLPESLEVEIRLGELVGVGDHVAAVADTILPSGGGEDALAFGIRAVRNRFSPVFYPVDAPVPEGRDPDRAYADHSYPDRAHRLLGAIRIWEVMRYFHAYRDLYDDDPDQDLEAMLPRFAAARDSLEYAQMVSRMVMYLRDSHGSVVSPALAKWRGVAPAPVQVRLVEGRPVITGFAVDSIVHAAGVRLGDVVVRVDGEPAMQRFRTRLEIMPGSNDAARARNVCGSLLNGPDSSVAELMVVGADRRPRTVRLPRSLAYRDSLLDLRKGAILRVLPGNIGYADLDRLSPSMVDSMFRLFRDTRGIVFDMRGYPQGTAWAIAPHLTRVRQVVAARFRTPVAVQPAGSIGDMLSTTAFELFDQMLPPPVAPWYGRPTVMLINEYTQSQAEHTGLFFEAANGTRFVGSQTAGANGDVTNFYVPGGILIWFSGHEVRHSDGRQLQRVGLKPDLVVRPTIAAIRAGRDEMLERGMQYLLTLRSGAK